MASGSNTAIQNGGHLTPTTTTKNDCGDKTIYHQYGKAAFTEPSAGRSQPVTRSTIHCRRMVLSDTDIVDPSPFALLPTYVIYRRSTYMAVKRSSVAHLYTKLAASARDEVDDDDDDPTPASKA